MVASLSVLRNPGQGLFRRLHPPVAHGEAPRQDAVTPAPAGLRVMVKLQRIERPVAMDLQPEAQHEALAAGLRPIHILRALMHDGVVDQ